MKKASAQVSALTPERDTSTSVKIEVSRSSVPLLEAEIQSKQG